MKKRGQTSTEFLIFIGIASLLFLIFMVIAFHYLNITYTQQKNIGAQDLVRTIKNEINIAAWTKPNYERIINLPALVGGKDYTLKIKDREVIITIEGYDYVEPLATLVYNKDNTLGFEVTSNPSGNYKITKKDDNKVKIIKQ